MARGACVFVQGHSGTCFRGFLRWPTLWGERFFIDLYSYSVIFTAFCNDGGSDFEEFKLPYSVIRNGSSASENRCSGRYKVQSGILLRGSTPNPVTEVLPCIHSMIANRSVQCCESRGAVCKRAARRCVQT